MTVGELIEELRKFPEHHVAIVRYPDGGPMSFETDGTDEASIVDVQDYGKGYIVIDCTPDGL